MPTGKVISVGISQGEDPPSYLMIEDNASGEIYYSNNFQVQDSVHVTNYSNASTTYQASEEVYEDANGDAYPRTAECIVTSNGYGES